MEPNQDPDVAYMSLLNRVIPGVGSTPLITKPSTNLRHITSTSATPSSLTTSQQQAIKTLEDALENALFVSEGEEPYATVHIVPTKTFTSTAPALPSAPELLQILKGIDDDLDQGDDDDEVKDGTTCERTTDLKAILAPTNPGHQAIANALHSIFGYDATSSTHPVALYRVSPPSTTRVHLWVLGWVDHHLLGFHTISIES
ncbi:hypothetical protein CPC16_012029 [Podila verticillata]|nr:hypothetical protein BGZ52_005321 [Haplosporangium bisporale]KAF9200748.1 hypothetical protein BGZ59_003101 [Podila verticillata]KAF9377006.1 hypothetical protein CPC16_012029 [Podila verticillata]KAI9240968.1 MAG: hypothetical protein BYD32DRAFT_407144 [Podila humilis]KFH68639.1 hypothetical protein MVEG_05449 [Podila verticillata NRRL 6337]